MNKKEFIAHIANHTGLKREDVAKAVTVGIRTINEVLSNGEGVKLNGLGTFKVSSRPAYMGHHPKTGAILSVPAKKIPKFIPGKGLKEAVIS